MILAQRPCYLADGIGPLFPAPQPLEIYRGIRTEARWQAKRSDNAILDLTGIAGIVLLLRYRDTDELPFLSIPALVTDESDGLFSVFFDSPLLTPALYVYEVLYVDGTGRYQPLVPRSRIQVRPSDSSAGTLVLLPVYFGSAVAPVTIDQAFIEALDGEDPQANRYREVDFDQGVGEFGWYAYPASFGGTAEDFFDGDTQLEAGVTLVATINVTGDDAVARQYYVWRTDATALGAWTMEAR